MHDRREPSVDREHAIRASDAQPDAAVAVSTDESDEWLVGETYSDTDVSIRPRMHSHLSYRSGPELPGYGDDPVAMRVHQAIDAAVAEFIGYSERASLAPATPRRTPVGLPPQRPLPEAPRPRRPTPVSSTAARHNTPPPAPAMRVTPLPSLPPLAARSRLTPSEPQPAVRRSTPPPAPPSAAAGRPAPIPHHIETTPHCILPRPTPIDTRPAQRRSTPPPLPPSAASGRHMPVAASQPYGILPASTQTQAPRQSRPAPEPQGARRQTPSEPLTRTGRHPTPQPEPTGRHSMPGARRPTPAQALPPNPPLPPAPAARRNTPMPGAPMSPQQAAAETQPLPHASPRQTPSEPLPGATAAQGIPQQFQEQLLRAMQRAHESDVRSVAAERRAILAESAARAAAMSANVTQPMPRPPARARAGRALLWGAVCFSLGGYVALLMPIRERMLEQAEALRELGQHQTQALEAQRQYYQGEHERLERQTAELERKLEQSSEATKLTAAATTRVR